MTDPEASPEPVLLNPRYPQLWHGGDYNAEQWPREVWTEDMRLMQVARFAVSSIGIFSWAQLEPSEGSFDFEWLDELIGLLTENDRWFLLATPSASPPAWLSKKYPETLRTGADRVRMRHGNRVNYNLGSPIYREKVALINRMLAERYGSHPRLLGWHLSNEYGGADYGLESEAAFRMWLRKKYGDDLDKLNLAYWNAFWGHTVRSWDEIDPPGGPYGEANTPGLTVDWQRFVTDQTVEFMLAEAAPLRELTPQIPLTTNFMGTYPGLDYRRFGPHLDFVSWDSYPAANSDFSDAETWVRTSFNHDLMRSIKPERSWLLMESSPSSANWYPYMVLKPPGTHRFEGLQAIAHGSDGVQYFQWRQGRGGSEQLHGAVVGHAGSEGTRVFEEVRALGEELESLGSVVGSTVPAETAVYFDWENRWAIEAAAGPSQTTKHYEETCRSYYAPLWNMGVPVDLIGLDDDLDRYRLVIAPMIYSLRPGVAERLERFVERGGVLLVTYLSGWVDENSLIFEGGFLAPLRRLLGVCSEELDVLRPGKSNSVLVPGSEPIRFYGSFQSCDFCELIYAETADVLGTYAENFYSGRPAFTVNRLGDGQAFYVASRSDPEFTRALIEDLVWQAGVQRVLDIPLPAYASVQVRRGRDEDYVFFINANDAPAIVPTDEWGPVELRPRDIQVFTRPH